MTNFKNSIITYKCIYISSNKEKIISTKKDEPTILQANQPFINRVNLC